MRGDIKLVEGSLGTIRYIKACSDDDQIGILRYKVDEDPGLIGKIRINREGEGRGLGRRLMSRMFELHPEITQWRISAISGRRAALFWFAVAATFNVSIHSDKYGEISRASSRRHLIQWPDTAWQYWILPASLNRVRPESENEKDSYAGDKDFPFDGELYGALLSRQFRALDGALTVEAFRDVPARIMLTPRKEDTDMANTLLLVDLSLESPPEIEPWHAFEVDNVFDGVHRLSACRDHGVDAVVKSEATSAVADFLRVEDPSTVDRTTPALAAKDLKMLIAWWEGESPVDLRNLNRPHIARLHDARQQMRMRYGV